MSTLNLASLLTACVRASEGAGHIIREIGKEKDTLDVKDKTTSETVVVGLGPGQRAVQSVDPQTKADRLSQLHIISSLKTLWPSLTVIGEEDDHNPDAEKDQLASYGLASLAPEAAPVTDDAVPVALRNPQLKDLVVWVDPMDGTREFTLGFFQDVTVLIGISHKGEALAGLIHEPFAPVSPGGTTTWGVVGGDVYFRAPPVNPPPGRKVFVSSRSRPDETLEKMLEKLHPIEILRLGGAGNKILSVIMGTSDAYVYLPPVSCSLTLGCCLPG